MKQRAPLQRTTPLQRKPMAQPGIERPPQPLYRMEQPAKVWTPSANDPRLKENVVRSEAYLRIVASLPCVHCKKPGPSQAAHAEFGKGLGIKVDDRTAIPLCAPTPGRPGCHFLIGSTGLFTQEQRRTLERNYGVKTRAEIKDSGRWPVGLPAWPKDDR